MLLRADCFISSWLYAATETFESIMFQENDWDEDCNINDLIYPAWEWRGRYTSQWLQKYGKWIWKMPWKGLDHGGWRIGGFHCNNEWSKKLLWAKFETKTVCMIHTYYSKNDCFFKDLKLKCKIYSYTWNNIVRILWAFQLFMFCAICMVMIHWNFKDISIKSRHQTSVALFMKIDLNGALRLGEFSDWWREDPL